MNGLNGAITGFREAFTVPDGPDGDLIGAAGDDWGRYEARRLRYAMGRAYDGNTAYRDLHTWAKRYKVDYGLYKHVRCVYNPANRLNTFHAIHLLGGPLDPDAGDGKSTRSALPIDTENEALRPAIARLWRDSKWQSRKAILGRFGCMFGDVALKVVDDPTAGKVRLKVIDPKHLSWVGRESDDGPLSGYILQELRYDPRQDPAQAAVAVRGTIDPRDLARLVTYAERVTLEPSGVVRYETFLNGAPYAWPGNPADAWSEPYGFVPLVLCQHDPMGLDWGQAEFWPQQSKIREVDDLASKVSDQVRKLVDAPWIFSGVGNPKDLNLILPDDKPTPANPEPRRTQVPLVLLKSEHARGHAMVADLNLAAALEHIRELLQELERELPELAMDIWRTGDPSGRALRIARQRAEAKVRERRSGYDEALATAQRMAVAIGGHGGYPGYEGFTLDDYHRDGGPLEHRIGERPVFAVDELDRLDEQQQLWTNAGLAVKADFPLTLFLRREGWSDQDIDAIADARKFEATLPAPVGVAATNTLLKEQGGLPAQDGPPAAGGK